MPLIRPRNLLMCAFVGLGVYAHAQPKKPVAQPAAKPAPTAAKPAAPQPSPAPPAVKPAPAPIVPFNGVIGFRLAYTGSYTPEVKASLPDSMTMWVAAPVIRVKYHGGLSDTLGTEMHWDASQHRFLMIDPLSETAWTIDEPHAVAPKLPLKSVAKDTVAGLACKVFEIPAEGGKDRYSLSDSIRFPFELATDSLRDSLRHFVPPFLLAGQSGLPLRVVRTTAAGTVKATAITIRRGGVNPEDVRMPSGYLVAPFDPRPKRHPYLRGKE